MVSHYDPYCIIEISSFWSQHILYDSNQRQLSVIDGPFCCNWGVCNCHVNTCLADILLFRKSILKTPSNLETHVI